MLGAGAIYPIAESEIIVPTRPVPSTWRKVFGMDVGWNKTAVVWAAENPGSDALELYDEYYQGLTRSLAVGVDNGVFNVERRLGRIPGRSSGQHEAINPGRRPDRQGVPVDCLHELAKFQREIVVSILPVRRKLDTRPGHSQSPPAPADAVQMRDVERRPACRPAASTLDLYAGAGYQGGL